MLAVLAFHAKLPFFEGGFVGVDVFFVISGYLITDLLLRDMRSDRFSFAEFYARRARRILPAALVMMIATMLFACVILTPRDLATLAGSALSAVFFLTNQWFASHSGYFDTATDLSPLAHMWSLAVEEQFYLLYPLVLVALLRRGGIVGVRVGVVVLAAASLLLSVLATEVVPATSFYVLPTRAWELLLGGLIGLWSFSERMWRPGAVALGVLGAALLSTAVFFLSPFTPYPGSAALLPVSGAALLLLFGHQVPLLGALLTSAIMRRIGDISYSLYLWHWPLIVYYRIFIGERPFTALESTLLVMASLAAGYLSWRLIERRFLAATAPPGRVARAAFLSSGIVAGGALVLVMSDGLPGRVEADVMRLTDVKAMRAWECPHQLSAKGTGSLGRCVVGAPWETAAARGIVWGDSHAGHWAPALHRVALAQNVSLVVSSTDCAPDVDIAVVAVAMPGKPSFGSYCTAVNRNVKAWLAGRDDISIVILAAAWSARMRAIQLPADDPPAPDGDPLPPHEDGRRSWWFERTLQRVIGDVRRPDRLVALLGDVPRPNRDLNGCVFASNTWLLREPCGHDPMGLDAGAIRAWHAPSERAMHAAARSMGVPFLSPVDRLCGRTHCPTSFAGQWIYMDENHIRHDLGAGAHGELTRRVGMDDLLRKSIAVAERDL